MRIRRLRDRSGPWTLEVLDQHGGSTTWEEEFATDQEAYRAFAETIEYEGIASFLEPDAKRR